MRVLFDGLLMAADHGGLVTLARHFLDAWASAAPADDVHVARPARVTPWRNDISWYPVTMRGTAGRIRAQLVSLPRIEGRVRPDITVSFNPIVPFRPSRHRPFRVLVLGDMRHVTRPQEFGWMQRVYRHVSWRRGLRRGDLIVAISHASAGELIAPTLRAKVVVSHPGLDHVDRWRAGCRSSPGRPYLLHLAHRSNKGTSLALAAWGVALERGVLPPELRLLVVGSPPRDVAVPDRTTFVPPLPQPDFECLMARASCLLFTSEYEGYGLPVGEAVRLGLPVVTSAVPVAVETGLAVRMVDPATPANFATALGQVLGDPPPAETIAASAADLTWANAAGRVRQAVLEHLGGGA